VSAIVVEFAFITTLEYPPSLKDTTSYVAGLSAVLSIAVLLMMPFRPESLKSDSISVVGADPERSSRSPEDDLRLWQFLCASWVYPLITIGKKEQINEENVWSLGYEFQHKRLHDNFRLLQGSVISRLLQANGIDCLIMIILALVELLCCKFSRFE
jgi:hypothetical protein